MKDMNPEGGVLTFTRRACTTSLGYKVFQVCSTCACRYPGTTFMDHIIRFHDDSNVKMIVVLGEVSKQCLHVYVRPEVLITASLSIIRSP